MKPRTPLIATVAALGALAFAGSASAATSTFSNTNSIAPHDKPSGSPNPGFDSDNYPSSIGVHGVPGSVEHVTVKLNDISSTFPGDLDVMLVAPDGLSVMLMSDNGRTNDVNGLDLTFDDAAPNTLPDDATIASGMYKPSNNGVDDEFPEFGAPNGSSFAPLHGADPNGSWRLLAVDDATGDIASIAGGWQLTLTTGTGAIARNRTPINAPDRGLDSDPPGLASPYPSDIDVSGVEGQVAKITVTLHRVIAQHPEDADVLLVAPDGRALVLMSDAFNNPIDGPITFDDLARLGAPKQQGLHESTFRPANYDSGQPNEAGGDAFPSPAPVPPYVDQMSLLRGASANGKWRLFVTDDHDNGAAVQVTGGWSINFTTVVTPAPTPTPKPKPQPQPAKPLLTSLSLKATRFTAKKGTTVRYGLSASAQVRFQVQRRTASGKFKTLRGTITKSAVAGVNKTGLRGKIGGKRLKPGSYRLKASLAGGNSRKVRFRIVAPAS